MCEPQSVIIVLNRTAFYGESGGQTGGCEPRSSKGVKFAVTDCQNVFQTTGFSAWFLRTGDGIEGIFHRLQNTAATNLANKLVVLHDR